MTRENTLNKEQMNVELTSILANLPETTSWDALVEAIYAEKNVSSKYNKPTERHNTHSYHPENITVFGVITGVVSLLFWFLPFLSAPLVPIALVAGVYGAMKGADKAWTAIIIALIAWVSNPVMSPFSGVFGLTG
jgi:hypothetical protein